MSKVKQCPCCGGDSAVIIDYDIRVLWVECERCGLRTPQHDFDTSYKFESYDKLLEVADDAISAWNKRTPNSVYTPEEYTFYTDDWGLNGCELRLKLKDESNGTDSESE